MGNKLPDARVVRGKSKAEWTVKKMVSFICNACGQTVRKAQVERHYQNDCHGCDVLSCIDCGKDFHGDEYTAHTSCITEAEKYQGKLYKPKDKQNKGEHKQQEWLKQVRETTKSGTVDPRLAGLLDRISEYSNIPRKKAKFQNFCRNSINVRDSATLDGLWEVFSSSSKSPQQTEVNGNSFRNGKSVTSPQEDNSDDELKNLEKTESKQKDKELVENANNNENKKMKDSKLRKKSREKLKDSDASENGQKSKRKKNEHHLSGNTKEVGGLDDDRKQRKRKRREVEEMDDEPCTQSKVAKSEDENEENKERYHFKWKSVIKAVLREAPDHELPMKRLRKKVLAEFQAQGANEKSLTDNELRALFKKKVTSNPKFKVHKDRVRLVK